MNFRWAITSLDADYARWPASYREAGGYGDGYWLAHAGPRVIEALDCSEPFQSTLEGNGCAVDDRQIGACAWEYYYSSTHGNGRGEGWTCNPYHLFS